MIRRKKREPVGHGGIGRTRCVGGVGDQRPHNPSKAEVYSSFYLSVCLSSLLLLSMNFELLQSLISLVGFCGNLVRQYPSLYLETYSIESLYLMKD
jgi:hypothetical protein